MARKWTAEEEKVYRRQLIHLYEIENKTIAEISIRLGISEKTVFKRMIRLGVQSRPERKTHYQNRRRNISLPCTRSSLLAEFMGIMLGDGHISHFQVIVTLGSKESEYAQHVCALIESIFGVRAKVGIRAAGYRDVYLGSVELTNWLREQGLVQHKVKSQVDVPKWIFKNEKYMQAFIRGFFDTDGSVYKLKYGIQISLTNFSLPLLVSLQSMLTTLGYAPSVVSSSKVYITQVKQVDRFFQEIQPANLKHFRRYEAFTRCVGTQVVNEGRL